MPEERVPTGNPDFDRLLGGGYEPGTIIQMYGEPASGKSSVCILSAVQCLRTGRAVIYIDTEGFSIERFRQVAGTGAETLAEKLYIYEPTGFDQQGVIIAGLDDVVREKDIGLIVVDSVTALYRMELEKGKDVLQKLSRQVLLLLGLGKRYQIPVIITNQVYMDMARNTYAGLGGTALEHISKTIVRFSRRDGAVRRACLTKHRSLPADTCFDFEITGDGIRGIAP